MHPAVTSRPDVTGAGTRRRAATGAGEPLTVLSVLAGAVRGNLTLLQATAVTDRWRTARYGRLAALLTAPAPFAGAALAAPLGGYPQLCLLLAGCSAAAVPALGTRIPARARGRGTRTGPGPGGQD